MADKYLKFPENIYGKYYIDQDCIGCNLCTEIAPSNFKITDDADHYYAYKQPITEKETRECEEAMNSCPVEAIGNDGLS